MSFTEVLCYQLEAPEGSTDQKMSLLLQARQDAKKFRVDRDVDLKTNWAFEVERYGYKNAVRLRAKREFRWRFNSAFQTPETLERNYFDQRETLALIKTCSKGRYAPRKPDLNMVPDKNNVRIGGHRYPIVCVDVTATHPSYPKGEYWDSPIDPSDQNYKLH